MENWGGNPLGIGRGDPQLDSQSWIPALGCDGGAHPPNNQSMRTPLHLIAAMTRDSCTMRPGAWSRARGRCLFSEPSYRHHPAPIPVRFQSGDGPARLVLGVQRGNGCGAQLSVGPLLGGKTQSKLSRSSDYFLLRSLLAPTTKVHVSNDALLGQPPPWPPG